MSEIRPSADEERLFQGVLRFNAKIWGLVCGLLFGLAIFIATNWIVIKGGPVGPGGRHVIGPHLRLLSQFFIGYRVSFFGSLIGFLYGFALGTIGGTLLGWVYNKIIDMRNP